MLPPSFPPLADLLDQFRALAQVDAGQVHPFSYGRSRQGEDLLALSLGGGGKRVLAYAFPQPDEPLGGLALLQLARQLLGEGDLLHHATWLLLPCVDPDGARLNERWFTRPLDLTAYARRHVRPPEGEQVEWTFSSDDPAWPWDRPLPETRALAALLEEYQPHLLVPLHNSLLGGAYAFLTAGAAGLSSFLPPLWERAGLPTHLGEAELPFAARLAPGVFRLPSLGEIAEALAFQGVLDPPGLLGCGAPGYLYAARVGQPQVVVPELPLFVVAGIDDPQPAGRSRRHLLRQTLAADQAAFAAWQSLFQRALPYLWDTPVRRALEAHRRLSPPLLEATARWLESDPALGRPATVAEEVDSLGIAAYVRLLPLGMLVQALEEVDGKGAVPQRGRSLLEEASSRLDRALAEVLPSLGARPVPVPVLTRVVGEVIRAVVI